MMRYQYRMRLVPLVLFCAWQTIEVSAQLQEAKVSDVLAFDAASIKPSRNSDKFTYSTSFFPGRSEMRNAAVRYVIAKAYDLAGTAGRPALDRLFLIGGDQKILESRFDIIATMKEGTTTPEWRSMLRTLLKERFKLRVRIEMRRGPVYDLVVAREGKLGPGLRATSGDCAAYRKTSASRSDAVQPRDNDGQSLCWPQTNFSALAGGLINLRYAGSIPLFIGSLQPYVDRYIRDNTGLTGNYEWNVTFEENLRVPGTVDTFADAPPLSNALQEQLGLKLNPTTGPLEVLVIDSLTMPTPD